MTVLRNIGAGVLLSGWGGAPVLAQDTPATVLSTQALLVIAALLCVSLLVVAITSLWQSHRMYIDTVRLHQDMTTAQQAFLTRVLQAVSLSRPAGRRDAVGDGVPLKTRTVPVPPANGHDTNAGTGEGRPERLKGLDDVELAVLEKLTADPAFFVHHPLEGFGASQRTIDVLLRRGLARLDGLGRPAIPPDIQDMLRAWGSRA